jgi:hypothetical protein
MTASSGHERDDTLPVFLVLRLSELLPQLRGRAGRRAVDEFEDYDNQQSLWGPRRYDRLTFFDAILFWLSVLLNLLSYASSAGIVVAFMW